ncbi:MAG: hypothetical protein A2905_02065 [Candidatus Levybacteria bacterium RIFCSPLOWO2_01_FULL_36_10]|nr:MAG: hypothetical protein A2905_02065 [Candidatus Levybacteria bacterium RIFCSPLOWO2_01_FULL_36_10]
MTKKIVKIILAASLILFIFSFFEKNNLPQSNQILSDLKKQPLQEDLSMERFFVAKSKYIYELTPKYTYEIYGLVVSDYNSQNILDIHHQKDPYNTKDICLVWGDNLNSDIYRKMKFTHGEFTCYVQFPQGSSYPQFHFDELSNNHLLAATDEIYRLINDTNIGDQVYAKGYLVDYTIRSKDGEEIGTRQTSITRSDRDCEIIYVTDYKILKKGNLIYGYINNISLSSFVVSFVILLLMFVTS